MIKDFEKIFSSVELLKNFLLEARISSAAIGRKILRSEPFFANMCITAKQLGDKAQGAGVTYKGLKAIGYPVVIHEPALDLRVNYGDKYGRLNYDWIVTYEELIKNDGNRSLIDTNISKFTKKDLLDVLSNDENSIAIAKNILSAGYTADAIIEANLKRKEYNVGQIVEIGNGGANDLKFIKVVIVGFDLRAGQYIMKDISGRIFYKSFRESLFRLGENEQQSFINELSKHQWYIDFKKELNNNGRSLKTLKLKAIAAKAKLKLMNL